MSKLDDFSSDSLIPRASLELCIVRWRSRSCPFAHTSPYQPIYFHAIFSALSITKYKRNMRFAKYEPYLIFFGSLLLFLYGIFGRELVGFETRFVVFAHEVLQFGPHFFPTTYGLAYPDYPAGLSLINASFALLFGKLSTFAAILPSAIASSLTLVFIYKIVEPLNRSWAQIAVLLCLFTYEFFDSARTLSMDPFVMLASVWAFYVIYQNTHARFIWLALPLVFGFLIRGPIGLIMPAAAVVAFLAANAEWKPILRFAIQSLTLLIISLLLLLAAAQWQGGAHFVKNVLIMQIFGRLDDSRTHDFFAYFTYSFVNYCVVYELAIACVIACFSHFKSQTKEAVLLRAALLWVIFILMGMSIPEVRKIRYILPMTPALAIIAAYLWIAAPQNRWAKNFTNAFYGLCLALPFIFILLTIAAFIVVNLKSYAVNAHYFSCFCCLSLFGLMSLWVIFQHPLRYANQYPKRIIGLGLASFMAAIIFVVQPIEVSLDRIQPFVNHVLPLIPSNHSVVFFQLGQDAEPIQFLSALPMKNPPQILFAQQLDTQHPGKYLYLTKASTFDALSDDMKNNVNVVLREKLGHREMVVFAVK